jgi:hypothetical protein
MDLQKAKTNQVTVYKSKLNSRTSLQTGGSLLVSVALERKKKKEVDTRVTCYKRTRDQRTLGSIATQL